MQLSNATSTLDSNPLPLSPAAPGSPAVGEGTSTAFADFMPALVVALTVEVAPAAPAPLPPSTVPGGLVFTLASQIPAAATAILPASPLPLASPAAMPTLPDSALAKTARSAPALVADTVIPDAAPADSPSPLSNSPRPARAPALPASSLRSARTQVRPQSPSHAETLLILPVSASPPVAVAPLPADVVIALPTALAPDVAAPTAAVDSDNSDDPSPVEETPARAPVARNPWLLPTPTPAFAPSPDVAASIANYTLTPPAQVSAAATLSVASAQTVATPNNRAAGFPLRAPAGKAWVRNEAPTTPSPASETVPFATPSTSALPSVSANAASAPFTTAPSPATSLVISPAPTAPVAVTRSITALPTISANAASAPLATAPSPATALAISPVISPALTAPVAVTRSTTALPTISTNAASAPFATALSPATALAISPAISPALTAPVAVTTSTSAFPPVIPTDAGASSALSLPAAELSAEISPEISVTTSPENRPAPRSPARAEKFAAACPEILSPLISAPPSSNKNFLTGADKEVTQAPENLGITVAKSAATMTAAFASHPSAANAAAAPGVNAVSAPASPAPAPSLPATAAATPAEIIATAHQAVDAVLASTERLASATPSSVNLKFSVGGANLDVRVEVRAGAVHATFRTDSPELRTALAQEWQATNSQPADHSLRLAPPVFASGDRSGAETGTGFSGEQFSQARDQPARPAAEFVLPGPARNRPAAVSSAGPAGVSALPARPTPATTLPLHAFA